ncbi:MAG: hypothetical protein SFZ23_04970 [Planctomycetota bacterium]|nr:hypothetical protein [Planctomycetota bacterium]
MPDEPTWQALVHTRANKLNPASPWTIPLSLVNNHRLEVSPEAKLVAQELLERNPYFSSLPPSSTRDALCHIYAEGVAVGYTLGKLGSQPHAASADRG